MALPHDDERSAQSGVERGRPPAPVLRLAALLIAALASAACGHDFLPGSSGGGEAAPLAATYDLTASYPSLLFAEFPATGLALDVTMEIDPVSLDDPSGLFSGWITIHGAEVGGLARSFSPAGPIAFTGRLTGSEITLRFGPITVGTTTLYVDLAGSVRSDGRRMEGLAALGSDPTTGTWLGVKQRRYLITATDFSLLGTVTIITVRYDTRFTVDRDVELTSGDPVAAASGSKAFVVNRLFFDNIQILDPDRGFATAQQWSTGNGSNPHDVLMVDGGRLYVPRYEPPFDDVMIMDPSTGAEIGSIPLGAYATNTSATPRPDRAILANGLALVTLQNIDTTFTDYGPGLAVFIDPSTDGVVKALLLEGQNPIGPPSIHPETGEVYLSDAGVFRGTLPRTLTGGIEVIDPISLTTRGLIVDDDDLGGNVSGVAVCSGSVGYAVVVTSAGRNDIVAFDPATGAPGATVFGTPALIPEIRYDGDGYLLVAEHDVSDPGLRVLDAASGAQVARIPLSLPPFSIAVLTKDLSGR